MLQKLSFRANYHTHLLGLLPDNFTCTHDSNGLACHVEEDTGVSGDWAVGPQHDDLLLKLISYQVTKCQSLL